MVDYLAALRSKAREVSSLDSLVESVIAGAHERGVNVEPHSKGTWSRILAGKQDPSYDHLVEIALACDLPIPERPPQVAAQDVEHWHTVGENPPRFGLLMDQPANVRVTPDAEAPDLIVKVNRPKRRHRRRRSTIHLEPEDRRRLAEVKERLGMTWPAFVQHVVVGAVDAWLNAQEDGNAGAPLHLDCGPGT